MKDHLTLKQVSQLLGVTPLTLRNWDKKGKLPAYRHPINNYRVYKRADIEIFLRKLENSRSQDVIAPRKLKVRTE